MHVSKNQLIRAVSTIAVCVSPTSVWASMSIDAGCMEDTAGFALQCSANDIQVAGVARFPDGSPQLVILDDGCAYRGDTVTFTATFDVVTTAKSRHDVGIYFVTDGDPNGDGALSGSCNISTMPYTPDPPWLDLDGTQDPLPGENTPSGIQDLCGDIDKPDHNPLQPELTLTVTCIDPDEDGQLNLPNCTSWRQSGANELCTSPTDAFPGSPSKCRCDDAFNIPIDVPPAELLVSKTASPTSLAEPGGLVTFTINVTNIGIDPTNSVTLDSLTDDIYGDITTAGHDGITQTSCSVPQVIPADDGNPGGVDTYSCSFTVDVQGNGGEVITDVVTATGTDIHGNQLAGDDDAHVTLIDQLPLIAVTKLANPTEVLEPGGLVNFSVLVENQSPASSDPVTIDSLVDSIHGDLNGQGDCGVPQVIAAGQSYACTFNAFVAGNAYDSETDVITASGSDDEGNPVSESDSATVLVLDVPSTISIVKNASPSQLLEPGGNVSYSYVVTNDSTVDSVTIDSLTDDILGDLNGQGDCLVPQLLAPGASYACTVIAPVSGNGHESITNIVTASGVDDDGATVMAMDDATVNIENVPPAASLTKTAVSAIVTFAIDVQNDSDAEPLSLTTLVDDVYGDITQIQGDIHSTTCSVPQSLAPAGQPGDHYQCSFEALVSTSPHVDTVTATLNDDDGSTPITPSDSATVTLD